MAGRGGERGSVVGMRGQKKFPLLQKSWGKLPLATYPMYKRHETIIASGNVELGRIQYTWMPKSIQFQVKMCKEEDERKTSWGYREWIYVDNHNNNNWNFLWHLLGINLTGEVEQTQWFVSFDIRFTSDSWKVVKTSKVPLLMDFDSTNPCSILKKWLKTF